jgi:POT family proton-dependent oligopeptide transporter
VQHYIYATNPCGYYAGTCTETSNLNVWIQSGSYVLIALSEILASITGLEYAFTKAPKNMRSMVMSVFLFANAISSALGEAFVCKPAVANVRS